MNQDLTLREKIRNIGFRSQPELDVAVCIYSCLFEAKKGLSFPTIRRRVDFRVPETAALVLYSPLNSGERTKIIRGAVERLLEEEFVTYDGKRYYAKPD